MANFRFEIGQKVVAHGMRVYTHLNGRVFTVTDRCIADTKSLADGSTKKNQRYYFLDPRPCPEAEGITEPKLAPYDPPGSWEDCVWQPKEIKA